MKRFCPVGVSRGVIAATTLFFGLHTFAGETDTEETALPRIEETVVLPYGPVRQKYSTDDMSREREAKSGSEIPTLDRNARNRVFEFVPRRREGQANRSGGARGR